VVVEKKGASIHNPGAWPTFSLSLKDASKISNSGSSSVPVRHTLIIRMPFIFRTEWKEEICHALLRRGCEFF
jgi:hypothetical protein